MWSYQIKTQFYFSGFYVTVNIGSFAVDNAADNTCDLYVELVVPTQDSAAFTQHIVFGAMWLQNFQQMFEYTYSGDSALITLFLTPSQYALPGVSISKTKPTQTDLTAFSYPSEQTITINVNNKTMTASVEAELGFQGSSNFMLSLSQAVVQAYSTNCTTPGVGQASCSEKPNFATNYFNLSDSTYLDTANVTLDGYTTQGYFVNQTICILAATPAWCSDGNEIFFVADTIVSNDWNYESPATAGILGLASGSPVWNLLSNDLTAGYYYSLQFANNTDWTFAQTNYTATVEGNSLTLGLGAGVISNYKTQFGQITISPTTQSSQLFDLAYFGFGMVD